MPEFCPECGARWSQAETCEEIFGRFLVSDFTEPGYGEVHALTVASLMVQHRRYSDEGLHWIAEQLRKVLEEGLTNAGMRQIAMVDARRPQKPGASGRTWKVTRAPDVPPLPQIAWTITIVDVAARVQDAETYRAAVREWAAATLREMQPWL